MGSISEDVVATKGTFTIPIFDGEPHSDPHTRGGYGAPPWPNAFADITFPLVDIRGQVLTTPPGGNYKQEEAFLRSHGFTAVKHNSAIKDAAGFDDEEKVQEIYYAEIEDLVKRVTGCKTVKIQIRVNRGGLPPADLHNWIGYKQGSMKKGDKGDVQTAKDQASKSIRQPIRMPHCDSTALGGRQTIRNESHEVIGLAKGIIAAEDAICAEAGIGADRKESREIIGEKYNEGKLGPRYAAYSIWRPVKPVTRDPLAMAPWKQVSKCRDLVIEPYDNLMPGEDGDWTKEFAMLKVKPEHAKNDVERDLKFYYVSNMQPGEVYFVTLFDSAGLGSETSDEVGCLHGSPDLGDVADGDTRRSVEIRCMAFW